MASLHTYSSVEIRRAYSAPDFARDTMLDTLAKTRASFYLMIYQVTDGGLCDQLLAMYNKGIDVRLVVSSWIYGNNDRMEAQVCTV